MSRIGIVTGLRFEAKILEAAARRTGRADDIRIIASGPGRARARKAAEALLNDGLECLLSMGLAGGLDARLETGDIIAASAIHGAQAKRIVCDPALLARAGALLAAGGIACHRGDMMDAIAPVATRGAKKALYRQSRALAVDMESHGVAEAATAAGLPFLALRVIADPAAQEIPALALMGMRADGSIDPLAVIKGLVKSPLALPELIRLGRQSRRAGAALGRLGEVLFAGGL